MKLLLVLLFLVGCNAQPGNKSEVVEGSSDLFIYRHEDNNVTCYRVRNTKGLSCLRD